MENKYRLPKTIIPSYYSITIEPDLENEKFSGSEIISIEIKEKINTIKLNSIGLKIDTAEIISDELTGLLGSERSDLDLPRGFAQPLSMMMCGLHGAGKTTSIKVLSY